MPRFLRYALSLSLCLVGSQLYAQKALTELYGEGVHRYFAGDSFQAEQMLSRVIESGVEDPLLYYYRGVVREHQGGGGEFDFEEGARLEAAGKRGLGLRNGIGDALTRIQGHTRVKLEKARRDARVAAEQQALLMRQASEAAGEAPPPPVVPERAPVVPSVDATDPFGGTTAEDVPSPAEPAEQTTEPEVDSEVNPFDDDPAEPADDVPTGEAPVDPFGTDAGNPPAGDTPTDPFGTDAGTPPADDPFGTDPAPAGDAGGTDSGLSNPFGD